MNERLKLGSGEGQLNVRNWVELVMTRRLSPRQVHNRRAHIKAQAGRNAQGNRGLNAAFARIGTDRGIGFILRCGHVTITAARPCSTLAVPDVLATPSGRITVSTVRNSVFHWFAFTSQSR